MRRATEAAQRQRGSFRELCEEWYRNEIVGRGIKHPSVPRRHLDKYLLLKLGRTAAVEVTAADIARVIDEVKGRAPTAANDLLRFAHRIFAFGVRRRMILANPACLFAQTNQQPQPVGLVAPPATATQGGPTPTQAICSGASNCISQTGQQIVQRQLNIQPTLTIRPGFPVRGTAPPA